MNHEINNLDTSAFKRSAAPRLIDHCSLIIERQRRAAHPYSPNSYLLTPNSSSPRPRRAALLTPQYSSQPPLTSASSVVNNSPVVKSVQSVQSVANDNDQKIMTNDQKQGIPKKLFVVRCSLLVSRQRRRAAFTLVELLTVIAIMVIIAAVSIPAFAALFANNNMVQAQNQLSAAIAETRSLALQNHTEVALIFFEEPGHTDETAFAYEQESPGQGGQGATGITQYFQPIPQQSVQYLPKGVYVATLVGTANSEGINNADNGFALPPQQSPAIDAAGTATNFNQPNNNTNSQAAPLEAIVFDGNGHLVIVNSMITQPPEQIDQPANANATITWWNGPVASSSTTNYFGPSSPGFVLYEPANWPNPLQVGGVTVTPGAYLAANSDVTMVSTYTGNVVQ